MGYFDLSRWTARLRLAAAHRHAASTLAHTVMRLHHRIARMRSALMFDFGLTHARLRVLEVLFVNAPMSISDIARELDLSRQAVHRVVHDLAGMEFVELSARSGQGGARSVSLAADWKSHVAAAIDCARHWEATAANLLDEPAMRVAVAAARIARRGIDRAWRVWPDVLGCYAQSSHWTGVPEVARWPRPQELVEAEIEAEMELGFIRP